MATFPTAPAPAGRLTGRLIGERETWVLTAEVWAAIGAVTAGVEWLSADTAGAAARLMAAPFWWLLTLLAVALSDAATVRGARRSGAMLFHLVASAAGGLLWAAATYGATSALLPGWRVEGESVWAFFASMFPTTALVYAAAAGIAHGTIFAREQRAGELEAERTAALAAEAQLQALKMELQPHFLFNTLNSISALMQRDVDAANEVLVLLADMLGASLASVHEQEVELRAELETLRTYVRIQQIRLGDRLEVAWEVEPEALDSRVPHLILQPLVENAIVHGIEHRAGGGRVHIGAYRNGARLELLVRDEGGGAGGSAGHGFGVGLANTRARLEQLYGDEQRFAILDAPTGGTIAFVSIPSPVTTATHRPAIRP